MQKITILLIALFFTVFGFAQTSPVLIKDAATGSASGFLSPRGYVTLNGKAFFCNMRITTATLWASDGTTGGTTLLDSFVTGATTFRNLTVFKNRVFFSVDDGTHGAELWVTDGTPAGTQLFKDINPGATGSIPNLGVPQPLTVMNDMMYFRADDGVHGLELWRTDGTDAGTQMVKDINTAPGQGMYRPAVGNGYSNLLALNGKLYFAANDSTHGCELWTSDGTAAGTQMVIDFLPDTASTYPNTFIPFHNKVYFNYQGASGQSFGLYYTDGTAAGTQYLDAMTPYLDYDTLNGQLILAALTSFNVGSLVSVDANNNITILKEKIGNADAGTAMPGKMLGLCRMDGKIYFGGDDTSHHGDELWVTNGTTAGTFRVKDIYTGSQSSFIGIPVVMAGKLYFMARDSFYNNIWCSDGKAAGTKPVPFPGRNSPALGAIPNILATREPLMCIGNSLIYAYLYDTTTGKELYRIDGWPASVPALQYPAPLSIYPNPANTTINIDKKDWQTISVYDMAGRRLTMAKNDTHTANATISIAAYKPGLYMVECVDDAGERTTAQFVKE